jgi:hypothetical protein
VTVSDERSWGLWDSVTQKCLKKIALEHEPNWVESLPGNKVVVADVTGILKIFEIKY